MFASENQSSNSLELQYEDEDFLLDEGSHGDSLARLDLPDVWQAEIKANWYAQFVVRFPFIMPTLVIILVAAFTVPALMLKPLPNFGDPTAGFEARKTTIRGRSMSISNLHHSYMGENSTYTIIPDLRLAAETVSKTMPQCPAQMFLSTRGHNKRATKKQRHIRSPELQCQEQIQNDIALKNLKFVFESSSTGSLFTVESLKAMCELEKNVIQPNLDHSGPGCAMFSLPFYMSLLLGKSCPDFTPNDLKKIASLLTQCAPYFHNNTLQYAPKNCMQYNAVYNILHYLTDTRFFSPNNSNPAFLKYSLFILPYVTSQSFNLEIYEKVFLNNKPQNALVKISGVYTSDEFKYDVFDKYLMSDIKYFGVAMAIILLIMLIYLRSFILMFATLLNVVFSFALAYGIYLFVFRVEFFPFVNILAGLILIAIGADDVFIFCDALEQAKLQYPGAPLDVLMTKTFSHAILSVFVTSLTTSAAFFANFASNISAIRCFGLFAGCAVLTNFLMMVMWTPSIVAAVERVFRYCCPRASMWGNFNKRLAGMAELIYSRCIGVMVSRFWYIWVFVFTSLGIGSLVVVFYKPGFHLPKSKEMQLFPSSNPLENWDQNLKHNFQFILDEAQNQQRDITLYFVWGVHDEDNGRWYDPNDDGHLNVDKTFSILTPAAQRWAIKFIQDLQSQSFVDPHENIRSRLEQVFTSKKLNICSPKVQALCPGVIGCCNLTTNSSLLESAVQYCPLISTVVDNVYNVGEFVFDHRNIPIAFQINVTSNRHFTTSFETMDKFYKEVHSFMDTKLKTAPEGMKKGWFTAWYAFSFYDLQQAISGGTFYSVGMSLGVAMFVMLMTSLNILVTLYAMFTITLSIATTVAVIVLLGWDLNIIESMTISLAVGLSIDFTIHYGVAYRLSEAKESVDRVFEAFQRVGSPVAMAAVTTFAAGAAMMPSSIMAYIKLGIFLMLVMTFSWLYATFLFQAICRIIGPRGNFCQIPTSCTQPRQDSGRLTLNLDQHSLNSVDSTDSFLITF